MKRLTLSKFTFLITCALFLFSCAGTVEERMVSYSQKYNSQAQSMRIPNLSYTKATPLKGNILKMEFGFKTYSSSADLAFNKSMFEAMSPALVQQMCSADRSLRKLVKDGMTIRILLSNENGDLLSKMDVDKTKIDEVTKEASKTKGDVSGSSSKELNSLVAALQSALPLKDEETGVEITAIAVNADNYLIYTAIVPDDLLEDFNTDGAEELVKLGLVSDPQIKNTYRSLVGKGVRGLTYIYKDQKGKELVKIDLTGKDLLVPQSLQ